MMTREEVVKMMGKIDFAAKHWPDRDKHMGALDIPDDWFPNWLVSETRHRVDNIYCNKLIHEPLLAALKAIHEQGLGKFLHTYAGSFNIRMVRGSNDHFSAHAYGLALDINSETNPLGAKRGGFFDQPAVVKCFMDQGFSWGGNFHGRKDPMHFTWTGF